MPSLSSSWAFSSVAWGVGLVLLRLMMLRWSELEVAGGFAATALQIKLVLPVDRGSLDPLSPSFSELHDGEREGDEEEIDTASWSASSAASRRPRAAQPSIPIVEGRLLQAMSSVCRRHLYSNLLAGVLKGRPSCSFSAACPVCDVPSGLVPGDGADGRASRLRSMLGGEGHGQGLDCFLTLCSGVLLKLFEGLFVTCSFFEALVVICNSTAV